MFVWVMNGLLTLCYVAISRWKGSPATLEHPSYGRIRSSYGQLTPLSIASTGAVHCIDPRLGYPRSPAILVAAYALIDTLFPSVDDDGLRWVYPRLASGKPTQSPSNGNSPSTPRRYGVGESLATAIAAEGAMQSLSSHISSKNVQNSYPPR